LLVSRLGGNLVSMPRDSIRSMLVCVSSDRDANGNER
jgi:hypothetical protein